jgi:GT2 family glycosyltransferase
MTDKISIVIPTYESASIHQTLAGISKQSALDQVAEVIVAGQQTDLDSGALPQLVYLPVHEKPTPARNRNAGVRQASAEWILFTDSDCLPHPDWVEEILNSIQSTASAYAGSVDVSPDIPYWGRCDHLIGFSLQAAGITRKGRLSYAATLNFCIRKELFLEMGGFDEHFETPGGEDRDLCWRLNQAGEKIIFIPQASVIHNHPRIDFRSAWMHLYHYGEVTARFRLRHYQENSQAWKMGNKVFKTPLLGEAAAFIRLTFRAIQRPIQQPALLRMLPYWPGMLLLDIAHTGGMVSTLRKYGR